MIEKIPLDELILQHGDPTKTSIEADIKVLLTIMLLTTVKLNEVIDHVNASVDYISGNS